MIIKFAIKEFLDDRKLANLSLYTLENYERVLNSFSQYCINNEEVVVLKDVNREIIKGFLNYCRNEKGNSPRTINSKLRIIKVFFNYVIAEKLVVMEDDIFKNIRFAKIDDRVDVFTDRHIQQILRYFNRQSRNKPYHAYRNKMVVITMLGSGMRLGELCNLRWDDIDFDNQIMSIFGKKRKTASIPIANKLKEELESYYTYVKIFFDNEPSRFVFCASDKKQITSESIGAIFKRLSKILNFDDVRLSAHTFRHTFASRAIKNGMDTITLQRILRHESIQMTERYVNMWGTALKDKNEKYNPLNDIDL